MRSLLSKGLLSTGVLLLFATALPPPAFAATEKEDTISIDGRIETRGENVRIRINSDGISIESKNGKKRHRSKKFPVIHVNTGDSSFSDESSDIFKFGEDVTVDRSDIVRGDLVVIGGTVNIAGRVMGDVAVIGGDLYVNSGAEINGEAVVIGGRLEEDPEASIQGEKVVMRTPLPMLRWGSLLNIHHHFVNVISFFVSLVICVLLSCLVLLFLKTRVQKSGTYLRLEFFKSFGWGLLLCFASVFVVPMAMILLAITIIGIPLVILLGFSIVAICFIAWTVFAYEIGTRVKEKINMTEQGPFASLILGIIILQIPFLIGNLVCLIPFMCPLGFVISVLGKIVFLFAVTTGIGALFSSRLGGRECLSPVPKAPPAPPLVEGTE